MMEEKDKCECSHCHGHDDHHEHHEHHDHREHGDCGCGCGCGHDHEHGEKASTKLTVARYVVGALPVIVGFMGFIPYHIPLIAALIGYALFGFEVYRGMIKGFARKKIFTEFTLMCVATVGAFAIGEYADAAALMYLYSLGETISDGAYSRSKRSISELLEITPDFARVLRGGKAESVSPEQVRVGELIIVNAGERVPLDGVVTQGGANADTSSVTGEEKPLELYAGTDVMSGALLTDGSVTVRVLKEYENSVVARLRRAVEEARERASSSEKKISRFAAVFTPAAFAVSALIFAIGALVTGEVAVWLKAAITVLVVSCPCSLVLSVPLTYFAGEGYAARQGIIFRGGEVMDKTARLGAIAFDKTGTLTESGLGLRAVILYSDMSESEFLSLAKAVLAHSPHAAAVSFCRECGVDTEMRAENVENISGRGVVCTVNGKRAVFGNVRLMKEKGIFAEPCEVTSIFGAYDGVLVGRLEFSSSIKEGVADTVRELGALGVGRIAVISGDAPASVTEVCNEVGIDEYYSSCSPDEKLCIFDKIKSEQTDKRSYVAYCGDGLNDSAVICAADVGIAMGSCGSALTVECADIVLMDDRIEKINEAIRISRRTGRIANSNIALSLGIKAGVLILSVALSMSGAYVPTELAVVADVGAAVLAVLNSLRAAKKEKI